jgi:transposase
MDTFTCHGESQDVQGRNLGKLAVIAPMLERIKLKDIINQHIPADEQAEFDHGAILSLMLAARLYSPVAMSNIGEWAEKSGADIYFGIPLDKMNDDRLGRSLDAFFDQRHSILGAVALHVAEEFKIPLSELHYDPTHVLFEGAYNDAAKREGVVNEDSIRCNDSLEPAHITKGRGTDDAPQGALMIHVGLLTAIDEKLGPVPLFGHTIDGNQNGHTGIHEQTALIHKFLKLSQTTMISDRGTFSVGHMLRMDDVGHRIICAAPWGDLSSLFIAHRETLQWNQATFLSIEQHRRRDKSSSLPQEHYELAAVDHVFHDKTSGRSIDARVIFVFSTADRKAIRVQREKQIAKMKAELIQIAASVSIGRRGTDHAAISKRISRVFGSKDAAKFFKWDLVLLTSEEKTAMQAVVTTSDSKPVRGVGKVTHRFEWSLDETRMLATAEDDGYSAMVTTVPESEKNADGIFSRYRLQNYVEHANHQFKGPLAIRPLFLHSPKRVESLVFLMLMGLTTYFLLQRTFRQNTPEAAPQVEKKTTTEKILRTFDSYTILVYDHSPFLREVCATRLTQRQAGILERLNFPTPSQTLRQRLPPLPDG